MDPLVDPASQAEAKAPRLKFLQSLFALIIHSFTAVCLLVFLNSTQNFLLVERYDVDKATLGSMSGYLALADEIISVPALGMWGAISDRYGRPATLLWGYLITGLALFVFPSGRTFADLVLLRATFAVGSSALATMMTALLADVSALRSNTNLGKISAGMGLASGCGALLGVFGFLRLGSIMCLSDTYYVVGGFCYFMGILVVGFLYLAKLEAQTMESICTATMGLVHSFTSACSDSRVALALAAGFAARQGVILISSFLPLKVNVEYEPWECGLENNNSTNVFCGLDDEISTQRCPAAIARASSISGVAQVVSLIAAPVIGISLDRGCSSPDVAVTLAGALGVIAYGSVSAFDVKTNLMFLSAALFGMAQMSMILSSQILLVECTGEKNRGALSGAFSVMGGIGVILISAIGGILFDSWELAPFTLAAIVSSISFITGSVHLFVMRRNKKRHSESSTPSSQSNNLPTSFKPAELPPFFQAKNEGQEKGHEVPSPPSVILSENEQQVAVV